MKLFLTSRRTLWGSFWMTIGLTLLFGAVMRVWDFGIIDEITNPDTLRHHLMGMTDTQKHVHQWMTGTLDVAYPLAYGAFFIGMALRWFPKYGPWFALPSLAVIPVDLLEGVLQIGVLGGQDSWVEPKTIVTSLKLVLYIAGLLITLLAILRAANWARKHRA